MLDTKNSRKRIQWTRSDSEFAKSQPPDSAIKVIFLALERHGIKLEDSDCVFGTNSISKEEALVWGNFRGLDLWSNWEDFASSNRVLYKK